MQPPTTLRRSSLALTVARVVAVVVALAVLAWFVYDAQVRANRRAAQPAVAPASESGGGSDGEIPAALSSSKSLVIDEGSLLQGSKSGVIVDSEHITPLPSTKVMVIDESKSPFLFSSKFAAVPQPVEPAPEKTKIPDRD